MYLYLLLLPAVALVLFVAVTELKCYFRCQYYKKQGIPVYYTPFMEGLVHRIVKSLNTSNHLLALADDYNTTKRNGKPAFVLCNFRRSCANFNIVDVKLAKEFFTKEVEVSKREMLIEFHMPKGFLGEFGNEGLDHRAIFTEFFRVGNLNKLVPQVRGILAEEINRLKNKVDGSLNFTDGSHNFVKQYMIRLVDTLLFGYGAEVPKSKRGLSFSEEIAKICEIIYSKRVAFNTWNALTRDFLNKYKLLPGSREICERSDYLK